MILQNIIFQYWYDLSTYKRYNGGNNGYFSVDLYRVSISFRENTGTVKKKLNSAPPPNKGQPLGKGHVTTMQFCCF